MGTLPLATVGLTAGKITPLILWCFISYTVNCFHRITHLPLYCYIEPIYKKWNHAMIITTLSISQLYLLGFTRSSLLPFIVALKKSQSDWYMWHYDHTHQSVQPLRCPLGPHLSPLTLIPAGSWKQDSRLCGHWGTFRSEDPPTLAHMLSYLLPQFSHGWPPRPDCNFGPSVWH